MSTTITSSAPGLEQPSSAGNGLNATDVEFLMAQSQALWRESSFERLLQKFTELLQLNFGLSHASVFSARTEQNKLIVQTATVDLKLIAEVRNPLELAATLGSLNLKSLELRQGVHQISHEQRLYNFVQLGDQTVDWQILVWETVDENAAQSGQTTLVDFLVRQLQGSCIWFRRLDNTQALLYRDDLTGVYNSRYLEHALESEIRRSQRFQTNFSLLFVDLDDFKMVNDRFGHLNGSSVLKQMADVLRETLREVDSVIRFGGDEFVILLLGATANTGLMAAERIRRKIEDARFFLDDGNHISVTASIGIAAYPEHAKDRESLLKVADEMMYHSKKQGKNRVSLYQPLTK